MEGWAKHVVGARLCANASYHEKLLFLKRSLTERALLFTKVVKLILSPANIGHNKRGKVVVQTVKDLHITF